MLCIADARTRRHGDAALTAIKAGWLIDPETGTVAVNQIILIKGVAVSSVRRVTASPVSRVAVSLRRRY